MGAAGLDDLIPQEASLKIENKEYFLRKLNLSDEVWIKTKIGDVQKVFTEQDFEAITKIAFRLLKDKADFLPKTLSDYDENGNQSDVFFSGPEMLQIAIVGQAQKMELLWAVFNTFGISRPKETQEIDSKKK